MLEYEHTRTADIVNRLVALAAGVRLSIVLGTIFVFGALGSLVGYDVAPRTWLIGTSFGIGAGALCGYYLASLAIVGIEWSAQLLVAHGELLRILRDQDDRARPQGSRTP